MKRHLMLLYAAVAYLIFIGTMTYSVAFFGNLFVARTIDAAPVIPFGEALTINLGLLLMFGLQHSGMARTSFKRWLHARLHPCLERGTYVLASCIAISVLMALWQPMGGVVWSINRPLLSGAIYSVYFAGWALMFYATFLINHFELFGVYQVWTVVRNLTPESAEFRTPGIYRHVRHPIYLGWLMVVWASPVMTVTHLVFAAGLTIYMLIGIQLEERDLRTELADYAQYQRKVPMLLPSRRRRLLKTPRN